jgi:flavodoxin
MSIFGRIFLQEPIMKAVVVYYSWSGNTEVAAKTLAGALKAKTIELKETKGRKLPWVHIIGGFQAVCGLRSRLTQKTFDLKGADTVFVCSPIWGSCPAPAVNTFLSRADLNSRKVYALFTLGDEKLPEKALNKIASRVAGRGGKFCGAVHFQAPMKGKLTPERIKAPVTRWLKSIK